MAATSGTELTCDTNKSLGEIEGKFLQMWAFKLTGSADCGFFFLLLLLFLFSLLFFSVFQFLSFCVQSNDPMAMMIRSGGLAFICRSLPFFVVVVVPHNISLGSGPLGHERDDRPVSRERRALFEGCISEPRIPVRDVFRRHKWGNKHWAATERQEL